MTAPRDYIAEVQALVGEHCYECDHDRCSEHTDPPPAPDCATLFGALVAAAKLGMHVSLSNGDPTNPTDIWINGLNYETERDAANAICRLIIEHRENL